MKKDHTYLTTGQFAKLCHTTKHTLFHYRDIGLFEPIYTDENGYRYYHVLQYDSFFTIAQLCASGMPLAQIREYMDHRSPQQLVQLYQQQEEALARQIAELQRVRQRMQRQKTSIQQVLESTPEVFCEEQAGGWLLCSGPVPQAEDYSMTAAIGDLVETAQSTIAANTLGMLCTQENAVHHGGLPCRFYVYTDSPKQPGSLEKPAGRYLAVYHHGAYETLPRSVQKLLTYAQKHGLELEPWIYSETILGDWAVCQPEEYVIKVFARLQQGPGPCQTGV